MDFKKGFGWVPWRDQQGLLDLELGSVSYRYKHSLAFMMAGIAFGRQDEGNWEKKGLFCRITSSATLKPASMPSSLAKKVLTAWICASTLQCDWIHDKGAFAVHVAFIIR